MTSVFVVAIIAFCQPILAAQPEQGTRQEDDVWRTLPAPDSFAASKQPTERDENRKTVEQIARQMRKAYEEAEYISFDVRVSFGDPPAKIRCSVIHGQDEKVNLKIYDEKNQLAYEARTHTVGSLLSVQERNYASKQEADSVLNAATFPRDSSQETWDLQLHTSIPDAIFCGGYWRSWVGKHRERIDWWEHLILQKGTYSGIQEIEGHPCHLIEVSRHDGSGKRTAERLYIDQRTFLVREWDQVHRGVLHTRRFTYRPIDAEPSMETFAFPPLGRCDCPLCKVP